MNLHASSPRIIDLLGIDPRVMFNFASIFRSIQTPGRERAGKKIEIEKRFVGGWRDGDDDGVAHWLVSNKFAGLVLSIS